MILKQSLFATFALCLAAVPALAQQGRGKQVREACQADYKALCSDVQPGGGRVLKCFEEHREQVSKECRAALEQARAARDAVN